MKKRILFIGLFLTVMNAFTQQNSFQVWTETGVKGKINKKIDYSCDITNRFGQNGLVTFFPQGTIKYKLSDWLKPSLEYRWIANREDNGNYLSNHRINANVQLSHSFQRINFQLRVRYQYSFKGVAANYEPEFDKAIRIKPSIGYDLKNTVFSPIIACEFFYNPEQGPFGRRMTRIRSFIGTEINLTGPHDLQLGYFFDQKINLPRAGSRHVLSLAYVYNISSKSKKKKKKN
jgi:hypothetical protein